MAKKDIQSDSVEAFILRDCGFGTAGDVVTLTSADAELGKVHGMLDLEPAAIAHAKGDKQ